MPLLTFVRPHTSNIPPDKVVFDPVDSPWAESSRSTSLAGCLPASAGSPSAFSSSHTVASTARAIQVWHQCLSVQPSSASATGGRSLWPGGSAPSLGARIATEEGLRRPLLQGDAEDKEIDQCRTPR